MYHYYNEIINPKILALHIWCWKVFIAYDKSNSITTMKKHVELEHIALL
jgi:hypothetical protein